MLPFLSKLILKILGWKIVGEYPHHLKKFILVVVPHTSNWDFPLGIMVRTVWDPKRAVKFIGKDSLFKRPHGFFFYWLGGYPVDRSKRNNFVQAVVDIFNSKEKFAIVLAPEGTRKRVEKLKTGFYFIAKGAQAPLILVKFDYEHKEVKFSEPFYTTENQEADFEFIDNHFRGVKGKIPEKGYLYEA